MQLDDVCKQLHNYISEEILEGKSIGLENNTPLLEWGIINSLEIVRLSNFVKESLGVAIPNEMMTAETMQNITSIGTLILTLNESTN
ncbi:MAG: acyl carrier protein [Chloroflexota bacterium]